MDIEILELGPANPSLCLDLLGAAMRDACRVAHIPPRATEGEPRDLSLLRVYIARGILEGLRRGERDPARLRVMGLRSTIRCCASDGVAAPAGEHALQA